LSLAIAPHAKLKPKPESDAKEARDAPQYITHQELSDLFGLKILKPIAKTIACDVKNNGDLLTRNWNGLLLPFIASPCDLSHTPGISGNFASRLDLILFGMTVNNPTKYDSKCIVLAKYIEKLVLE
jgi:hypothetical protein